MSSQSVIDFKRDSEHNKLSKDLPATLADRESRTTKKASNKNDNAAARYIEAVSFISKPVLYFLNKLHETQSIYFSNHESPGQIFTSNQRTQKN
jgi:hypothetical protein